MSAYTEKARAFGKWFAGAWDDGTVWEGNYVTGGLDDTDLLAEALAIHVAAALEQAVAAERERCAKEIALVVHKCCRGGWKGFPMEVCDWCMERPRRGGGAQMRKLTDREIALLAYGFIKSGSNLDAAAREVCKLLESALCLTDDDDAAIRSGAQEIQEAADEK